MEHELSKILTSICSGVIFGIIFLIIAIKLKWIDKFFEWLLK